MKVINFIILFVLCFNSYGQDLLQERIRKISSRKQSVFLNRGVFHNGTQNNNSTLKAIRHHYSDKKGFERVVFDFEGKAVPRIYGHIDGANKKLYVDFFSTKMSDKMTSYGKSNFIENFDFFPISDDSLSLEISLKEKFTADLFVLENPGRFVIDIKR